MGKLYTGTEVIIILWCIFILSACDIVNIRGAEMDKFDWKASESAPRGYPMKIIKGDFIYPDGGSLYVPNMKTIYHGWGRDISSHIVGPDLKPIPEKLDITFFSYTENKFYQNTFNLPYDQMVELFNDGYFSPKEHEKIRFSEIIAGVAPGGWVAVWLSGIDRTQEVYFGKAKEADVDWSRVNDNPNFSREEYIEAGIEEALSQEELASLRDNGVPVGLWEYYHRSRYYWQPVFSGMEIRDGLINLIDYYNGEKEYLYYPLGEEQAAQTRAVPKEMMFVWKRSERLLDDLVIELYFDEKEIFKAFENLNKGELPLQLEMRMERVDNKNDFTVWLTNEQKEIEFKQFDVKTYKPGGLRYKEAANE